MLLTKFVLFLLIILKGNMMRLFKGAKFALLLLISSANVNADTITTLSIPPLPAAINYANNSVIASVGNTFWDSYFFTVPESSATSVTTVININDFYALSNVSARIYQGGTHETALVVPNTLAQASAITSNIAPGVDVSTIALNVASLSAGTYTLQIKGNITGSIGGGYSGVLQLAAPIPEPESYGMLLAGLGLITGISRLRKKI